MMLDHVALLVRTLEATLEQIQPLGLAAGPIESFPGEGTREVYVGEEGRAGRLLLMQPTSDQGPYARALAKRGPGLHHVALRTPDLQQLLASAAGWLLHPHSLESHPRSQTLWLARPGIGALLELNQNPLPLPDPPAIEKVGVQVEGGLARLLEWAAQAGVVASMDGAGYLEAGGQRMSVAQAVG